MSHDNICSLTRREFGRRVAGAGAILAAGSSALHAGLLRAAEGAAGAIRGEPTAEKVGREVLASGGNAVDAAVAAALTAAVVVPHQTGIGGYGGHMTLAVEGGKKITSIEFDMMAPAAATPDMFSPDKSGKVVGQKNMYGWLAAGVPGILAGLELALKTYGTRPFRDVVQPALGYARDGFPFGGAAAGVRASTKQLAADPGSRALYLRDGKPLAASDHYANPDLAHMLESLAADNSVESFYRGDIAKRIAAAFAAGGGITTAADFAAYRAREVAPLSMQWGDATIYTGTLPAGGATTLQALLLLKELGWADGALSAGDRVQTQVEALRYAWQDRLQYFGDPEFANVPLDKLLSPASIHSAAAEIKKAVAARRPLPVRATSRPDQGTIHLSSADSHGNLVAVTLTHGGSFGARVTVPGLGLTLGHGMSRFDPHPTHPNAPGSHKRPLHNMCPTIVSLAGRPTYALGGRGGRKIPNAVAEVLLQLVAGGKSLPDAVAAPRMHTEGALAVSFEKPWPADDLAELKQRGYTVTTSPSATISAVGLTSDSQRFVDAMR
jgi:gamma-glutamyltranspeptidase/glutathione hydrolase